MIRKTYLKFFQQGTKKGNSNNKKENNINKNKKTITNNNKANKNNKNNNESKTRINFHRICSLQHLLVQHRRFIASSNASSVSSAAATSSGIDDNAENEFRLWKECQMAYTFVMGANPMGPKELVHVNESFPITVERPDRYILKHLDHEVELPPSPSSDIVFLNIHENMKEGKSQSWLKYVTELMNDENIYFDYIGKMDGDTLLYPNRFLNSIVDKLPSYPNNLRINVGDYRIKPSMPTLNIGPVYMGGHIYMMSPDLASYIVSDDCPRSTLAVYSEDQSIGNFIHSHPQKSIKRIRLVTNEFEHPVKRIDRLQTLWRKYLGIS